MHSADFVGFAKCLWYLNAIVTVPFIACSAIGSLASFRELGGEGRDLNTATVNRTPVF